MKTSCFTKCMALWLSQIISTNSCFIPNSIKIPNNHIASLMDSVIAKNSNSVVDNATTYGRLDFQHIVDPNMVKTKLN